MIRALLLLAVILVYMVLLPAYYNVYVVEASDNSIHVNPIPGLPAGFLRGVDLSEAPWILELGGKYRFENGTEGNIFDILREGGVNAVRLRVWNDPYDEQGNPYGGGNCDVPRMTAFASQAKAKGFTVLIDFHYSDWWADPGKQYKPKAWANLSFPELVEAVYNWTRDTLIYMRDNGALPDLVQVGNEIDNGFLWPDGRASNWTQFVTLLKSAISAIKDVDPSIKIVIHLSGRHEVDFYINYFDKLVEDGVEFDVIALSYYTIWHGTLEKLENIVSNLTTRYDKEIILAEIAYAWTLEDADGHPNTFGSKDLEIRGGYKATVQGQASYIRDIIEVLYRAAGNKALGVFYWGAAWIPYPGAGWKTGEGNPWENQALFDFNGCALPSLKVFRLIYESEYREIEPISLYDPRPLNVTSYVGTKPVLPSTVLAIYSDHSIKPTPVDWGEIPVYNETGTYQLRGFIAGTDIEVIVNIEVRERIYLEIPDPENDDKGPGTYGYPTAGEYKPGVFDIIKVYVGIEGDEFVIRVYFRDLGGDPWDGPNDFSLQYIHIYIQTTNPLASNKVYRTDTLELNIKLREDYGWQYALILTPGWGTEPVLAGELSALYYANGTIFVEDKDFNVIGNTSENFVEARIPRSLILDWENIRSWKIFVAVACWAGENPDRIRSMAPGGGEWIVDPTAYANETMRPILIGALLAGVLPKVYDIVLYSPEYPNGITEAQQYDWLMRFKPETSELPVIPPEEVYEVTVTQTITHTVTQEVERTTTVTETVEKQIEKLVGYSIIDLVIAIVIALVLGIASGYLIHKPLGKHS
ncbi:MAG: arabinogalactan endo-1,4-beta-galactosidase [Thermoprotei archaeon]|nr:MAG: arabinogalactan endo-1,4-beta-galactosidase [Thermoprotei archaeon]